MFTQPKLHETASSVQIYVKNIEKVFKEYFNHIFMCIKKPWKLLVAQKGNEGCCFQGLLFSQFAWFHSVQ